MKKLLFFTLAIIFGVSLNAQTWTEVFSGYTADTIYSDYIHMGTAMDAWGLSSGYDDNDNRFTVLLKTDDGGHTWTAFDNIQFPNVSRPGLAMPFSMGGDTAFLATYKTVLLALMRYGRQRTGELLGPELHLQVYIIAPLPLPILFTFLTVKTV